jgi:hypothetical protein
MSQDDYNLVGCRIEMKSKDQTAKSSQAWVSLFNDEMCCYLLFLPETSETKWISQQNLLKRIAMDIFKVVHSSSTTNTKENKKDKPPKRDFQNRFVGFVLYKKKSDSQKLIQGQVKCFLPFENQYEVVYEDESILQVTQEELLLQMSHSTKMLKEKLESTTTSQQNKKSKEQKKDEKTINLMPKLENHRRKRRKLQYASNNDVVIKGEELDTQQPDINEDADADADADEDADADADTDTDIEALMETMEDITSAIDIKAEPKTTDSSHGLTRVLDLSPEITAAFHYELEETKHKIPFPPVQVSQSKSEVVDLASEDEDDEPIVPLVAVNEEEEEEEEEEEHPEIIMLDEEEKQGEILTSDSTTTATSIPFYVIDYEPHTPTQPLETRGIAYRVLRHCLVTVLKSLNTTTTGIFLPKESILLNPDVKDRPAVEKFVLKAESLSLLNHILSQQMDQKNSIKLEKFLKLIAMLPMPTFAAVVESQIGKTISLIIKEAKKNQVFDKKILELARWIKNKWQKEIQRPENYQSPLPATKATSTVSDSKQKGSKSMSSSSSSSRRNRGIRSGPSRQDSKKSIENEVISRSISSQSDNRNRNSHDSNRRKDQAKEEEKEIQDHVPIPKRPMPSGASSFPPPPPPPPSSAPPAVPSLTGRKSSLKPDWMRKNEERRKNRFTIRTNDNAEFEHYKRQHLLHQLQRQQQHPPQYQPQIQQQRQQQHQNPRQPPQLYSTGVGSTSTRPNNSVTGGMYGYQSRSGQVEIGANEEDAGERGVYGRKQKLSFGPKWSICEFDKKMPPCKVAMDRPFDDYPRYDYRGRSSSGPKSILRRVSKYGTGKEEAFERYLPS